MSKKIHLVRKHYYHAPWVDLDKRVAYYDACGFCGQVWVVENSTVFRKNVTCKKCLKRMKKEGLM